MQQMATRAGLYVRSHHNWSSITRKYIALYESLLNVNASELSPVRIGSKVP
jgi:hypothetical protein